MKFIRNNLIILTVMAILVSATVFTFAVDDSSEYVYIYEWNFDNFLVVNVITQNFRGCAPYIMSASYKTSHENENHADWVAIGCMESEHEQWKYGTSRDFSTTPTNAFVQKRFIAECWTAHDPEVDYGILVP